MRTDSGSDAAGIDPHPAQKIFDGRVRGAGKSGGTEPKRDLFETDSVAKASEGRSNEAPPAEESIGAGFVTDIETQRGLAVQSDEVDPLTESEIYLAYGRSSQAEQTLRDAIARTPDRIELKLKLLEVLQVLGQKEAFGELAGELRQIVGEGSSEQAHLEKLILDVAQIDGSDSVGMVSLALPGDSPGTVNESPDEVTPDPESVSTGPVNDDDIVFELDVDTEKEATPIAQTVESTLGSFGDGTPADSSDLELELEFPAENTLTNGPRGEEISMAAPDESGKADPAAALRRVIQIRVNPRTVRKKHSSSWRMLILRWEILRPHGKY